jgi:hypothetical protein
MVFKVDDRVRIRKVETFPGQFLGQAGMIGVVTAASDAPMGFTDGKMERHYTMDLWWPHDPDRVESISFPESQIELRSDE